MVMDPYDSQLVGLKYSKVEADIVTVSHNHSDHNAVTNVVGVDGNTPFLIQGPGEYEVQGVSIFGVAAFHDEEKGNQRGKNTIFVVDFEGVKFCHLGDLGHRLEDKQLTEIGNVDVLLLPVGGFFTIDAKAATEVVAQLEPRIVIPMHYLVEGMNKDNFSQLTPVEPFLSQIGASSVTPLPKLIITKEKLPDTLQIILLERKTG